jgi:C-terminal processing protease CtpA/Prc
MVAINESVDDTVKPGMELLSINGKPMTTIAAKVLPNLSADGDIETGKLRGVGRNLPVFYYLYVEQASRFNLRLRDGNRELAVAVDGVLQSDRQKNSLANPANAPLLAARQKLEWTKDNIGLRFLKDVAQIRVGGFGGRDFPAMLEKQFAEVSAKRARGLILDLRGNGGGVDNYGALLVSYLTSKPFRYFDRINMKTINPPREHTSFTEENFERLKAGTEVNPAGGYKVLSSMHTGLNEQQPQKSAFAGKVVILIDGGSFSTCADVCAVTHHLGRATFVGEETGGGYYGNNSGESLALTLPHSKIQVNVPMWEYWNSVPGYKHSRRGTIPDHKIQARIADTLAERDRAVEKALELLI